MTRYPVSSSRLKRIDARCQPSAIKGFVIEPLVVVFRTLQRSNVQLLNLLAAQERPPFGGLSTSNVSRETLLHTFMRKRICNLTSRSGDGQVVHVHRDAGVLLVQRQTLVVQLLEAHTDATLQNDAALLQVA